MAGYYSKLYVFFPFLFLFSFFHVYLANPFLTSTYYPILFPFIFLHPPFPVLMLYYVSLSSYYIFFYCINYSVCITYCIFLLHCLSIHYIISTLLSLFLLCFLFFYSPVLPIHVIQPYLTVYLTSPSRLP